MNYHRVEFVSSFDVYPNKKSADSSKIHNIVALKGEMESREESKWAKEYTAFKLHCFKSYKIRQQGRANRSAFLFLTPYLVITFRLT